MPKKSTAKRIDRLELVCIGAGFLLKKLQHTYGGDFGVGTTEQVRHCINDIKQIERARTQREAATPNESAPAAPAA
jgi:hypothetical protein